MNDSRAIREAFRNHSGAAPPHARGRTPADQGAWSKGAWSKGSKNTNYGWLVGQGPTRDGEANQP